MATRPMKQISGLPGLEGNTYTFVQLDDTLTTAGKAADAKKTGDELNNLKSAVGKPQTSILEQGNINSSTGVPSNSTAYIRTSEYLDINTVRVTKPSGVGMTIYYYANPTSENNGFLSPTASWSRNSARSGDVLNTDYSTATHVKIRWDISNTNPITVDTLLATGLSVDYYISSLGLNNLIVNAQQDIDTLETAYTTLDGVVYKQSAVSNNATSLMSLTNIGVYRCKASVAANITDAPSTGAFVVAVMESLGGGYMQQIYINANQEIFIRIINRTDFTVYKDWVRLNPPQYNPSVLTGKKWVACGDSFTHGDFTGIDDPAEYTFQSGEYAGELMVYPFFIGRRTGCTVINEAVNGSHMGYVEGRGNKNFSAPNGRYTQIPSDADYITLYFGVNDGPNHQNVPIGTITDGTTDDPDDPQNTTFYGAWNIVMDYLTNKDNYPNAKIGIIISNGCDNIDYPNAEIAIAKKWGVSYLDMNGDYKVPMVFRVNGKPDLSATIKNRRNEQYRVSETNGHPNVACHEDESTFIQAWLESI